MARLPSELPAYLRQCFGISRRTFERWCAQGDVPGAYRTKGGHWRVRKVAWATVRSWQMDGWRRGWRTRRDRVKRAIADYPCPDGVPKQPAVAALKLELAARGITEEDFWDLNLKERDPEKYHFLWEIPATPVPRRLLDAINDPGRAPAIAAFMMRLNGRKVARATLARSLRVSVATFYRKYGKEEIGKLCAF
jgi:hypothetical protein